MFTLEERTQLRIKVMKNLINYATIYQCNEG